MTSTLAAKIKVAVRLRPLLDSEEEQGHSSTKLFLDPTSNTVSARNERTNSFKNAQFDYICGEEADQQTVFDST